MPALVVENIGVFVEDYPDAELVRSMRLRSKHHLLGLYQGVPLTGRGSWYGASPTVPKSIAPTLRPSSSIDLSCVSATSAGTGPRPMTRGSTPATAQAHIDSGKLVALASTGLTRSAGMPNVPTIAESGYPGFSATNWYAFIATSKMSPALQERWNAELVKVLKSPDVVEALNSHGLTPLPGTRDELAKYMEKETATWGRIIRERKITME